MTYIGRANLPIPLSDTSCYWYRVNLNYQLAKSFKNGTRGGAPCHVKYIGWILFSERCALAAYHLLSIVVKDEYQAVDREVDLPLLA